MIIDCHTHLFPDKLCPGTIEKLAANNDPPLPYYGDGSLRSVEAHAEKNGIDLAVMAPIVVSPKNQKPVNDFALSVQEKSDHLITLGSIHPDVPNLFDVLQDLKARGVHGIKLHPDYQDYYIEEKRLYPLYQAFSDLKLPVLFHTGWDPCSPDDIHAKPAGICQVAEDFPNLTMIVAHTGGLAFSDCPIDIFAGHSNLYFDTAIAPISFEPQQYREIIDFYGADHFLFGTDFPWGEAGQYFDFFDQVGLEAWEKDLIFGENAAGILSGQGLVVSE